MRILSTLMLLLPLSALAHETWLAPTQRTIGPHKVLSFDMTSGERFPTPQTAIAPERIDRSSCRQAGGDVPLAAGKQGRTALRLRATLPAALATTCWVQLKPRHLNLSVAKVEQYLREIDAPESARKAWQSMPEPRSWSEVYTKNAKVIVPARTGTAAEAPAPVGLKLEFVPSTDLSTGKLNGPLGITVLLDGQPLAGLAVALWSERRSAPVWQTSDSEGRVSFRVPGPGRWLVSGTDLRAVDASKGTWESQFSTLTFEVLP
jgi:uncharacterized GH25 family protein